jgi:hypothetical protein
MLNFTYISFYYREFKAIPVTGPIPITTRHISWLRNLIIKRTFFQSNKIITVYFTRTKIAGKNLKVTIKEKFGDR